MVNYAWGVIVALLLLVAGSLALDNGRLEKQLSKCQVNHDQAVVSNRLLAASMLEQNTRLEESRKETALMLEAGRQAVAEAETLVIALEQRIADIRREPKAVTCEEVRQKLIRGGLL